MASKMLLAALCVVALLAVRSESHGLGDFTNSEATPQMQNFFKPEAAALPESLDPSSMPAATMAAKPEATVIPTTTTTATTADTSAATAGTVPKSSATPRRSVSVAAGVACGVAAVAVVGIAAAVAYVVRGRRGGARRGTAVQLGSSP
ncbi:hypothetical protein BDA96_06G239800 [Sorghum bicolor]|jgi:hypothetical protein|uniref:Uncharacterized protein n=2 Tax=Sorghum bicolor TaxID=4558 RepID=C5YG50_SORBI|nr:uncharacterized protein LOC8074722 [Sorghum bicolor]XP_021318725.1 uncharacterized protein LOC8074722 [Sorghum bicolor]XP_021318726.1 uncharacterized protein LOC8074722 [Sorghum bicolor]EES11440.1 hypothetical protein SORBI_3006G219100 [Sorghum bicolor]KAG0527518.1 hypothetical protein BDA96_06G239800 [Sorghum bicolor]OQU82351.1 hypothetical protein SORBI_3006G219100 [Sorghum bicolor]|eukprot:XP_002447112.1 uncharacterized protein LOC8074722 [Sorghum bicolor]